MEKTTLDILFIELKLQEIMIQYIDIIKKGNVLAGDKTPFFCVVDERIIGNVISYPGKAEICSTIFYDIYVRHYEGVDGHRS